MTLIFLALRTAVFATAFLSLWTWIALLLRPLDRFLGGPLADWTAVAGAPLLAAGALIAGWCVGTFVVRGRGTPAPFDAPRRLVAVGPYHVVRNPMYVGAALLLLGLGLRQRSPAIVLFVPVWWAAFHLFVVLYEERALRRIFDGEYEDYCRRTPRW